MTAHAIPDAAIEAAAKALRKKFNGYEVTRAWDSRDQRTTYRNDATAALEAAAPHIERAAVADELAELAEIMEPFSGKAGLANDATRGEIAKWLRARLASVRSTKMSL